MVRAWRKDRRRWERECSGFGEPSYESILKSDETLLISPLCGQLPLGAGKPRGDGGTTIPQALRAGSLCAREPVGRCLRMDCAYLICAFRPRQIVK